MNLFQSRYADYFRVSLDGPSHSGSSGELSERYNGQRILNYDYILFSKYKNDLEITKIDEVIFRYNTFFHDVNVEQNNPISIDLQGYLNKRIKRIVPTFEVSVKLISRQRWTTFPVKRVYEYDRINVIFRFKKPQSVARIRDIRFKLTNYLALFLQREIKPFEVLLGAKDHKDDHKKHVFLIEPDSISSRTPALTRINALSIRQQGEEFLGNLPTAIYHHDKFETPINLIRAYWVYKGNKVYLDNQVSVLLACIESIYEIIQPVPEGSTKPELQYENFKQKLPDLEIAGDLRRWLKKAGKHYAGQKTFADKTKLVMQLADESITDKQALLLNALRNDLMHGRLPDWYLYFNTDYERWSNQSHEGKIDLRWFGWAISKAVLNLIKDSGKRKDQRRIY